jgi:hypothetical protein
MILLLLHLIFNSQVQGSIYQVQVPTTVSQSSYNVLQVESPYNLQSNYVTGGSGGYLQGYTIQD